MSWELWIILGLGSGLVLYLIARFILIWYFLGGNSPVDYYSDLEK